MTEYTNEDEITCPYCDWTDGDSWEMQSSEEDYECGSCEKKFDVVVEHSVTYSTKRKECEEGKHELEDKPNFAMIFDSKRDYKTDIHTPKPKEKWEYVEFYHCENCDEREKIIISEEEYKKKYPYRYESTLKKHNLFVKDKESDQ